MSRKWTTWMIFGALVVVAFVIGRCTVGEEEGDEEAGQEEEEVSEWTCPMHPEIRQPEFGTCPICHMDLVPADAADGDSDIPSVQLSEGAARLAEVQNTRVETGPVTDELRAFGRVEVDEGAEVDIAAWTGGRIERLEISARGEEVRRGQLLARIYSPELYSSQRSLVQAVRNLERAKESESERRMRAAQASIDSARTELRLLGVDERQIDRIQETKQARETVDIYATASGTIRQRYVQSGDYVSTGDRILSLAPLDTVWGQLEIYERDLSRVSEGTPVRVEVPGLDGEEFEGRIEFISPEVDSRKRVAFARVVLPNEEGRLKPGMYLQGYVEIGADGQDTVSVPRSSVLWTGQRSLVYLYDDEQLDPPGYIAQPVKLGPRFGDRYVIEEGLEGGEVIAKRGVFRIDSELQLRGGPSMMSTVHAEGTMPLTPEEIVDVPPEGVEFNPPIDPEQLPADKELWYCDMGTVEWAQAEEGDGQCPVCGMNLTHREPQVVEVPPEGVEFDPPIDPEQLPADEELWYCDMGTVEWAQAEEGDGQCPICGMNLTHKEGASGNGHDHNHDHDHDHEGHDHAH